MIHQGSPLAKEGTSAKYEHTSKFTLASQRSFHITYERPIKPGENKMVRIEAPFTDEISSLAIVTLLDKITQSVIMLKVKFLRNTAMLDITNSNSETLILNPKEAIGILDLRSLGHYKIK